MIKKILGIATIGLLSITTASAIDCDGIEIGGGTAFGIGLGDYGLYNTGNNNCGMNIDFDGSIDGNFNFNGNVFRYNPVESYLDTYFWRTSDGLRYQFNRYNSTTVYNGLINGFFTCSEKPAFGSNYYLKNVSSCTYHSGFDNLSAYLQNPISWGYIAKLTTNNSNMAICVYSNNNYICMDRSNATDTSTTLISYSTAKDEAISNPFSNNGGKTPQRNSNSICPTMGQILNNYPTAYNTGLCYNSTLRYNNGQIETVEQKTIQETFENYNELQERWNIYNNNCRVPYTQEQCQGAFSGQRNKYSIISNAFNGNTESKRLWNYCNIYLNYDLNMSSCVASGWQGEKFTEKEIENTLLGIDNIRVLTPGTGNILNGLLGSGQTREDINIYDILGNLDQIKEKITSIFHERSGVNGIIPDYILWLILTTLLLTVLLKK